MKCKSKQTTTAAASLCVVVLFLRSLFDIQSRVFLVCSSSSLSSLLLSISPLAYISCWARECVCVCVAAPRCGSVSVHHNKVQELQSSVCCVFFIILSLYLFINKQKQCRRPNTRPCHQSAMSLTPLSLLLLRRSSTTNNNNNSCCCIKQRNLC